MFQPKRFTTTAAAAAVLSASTFAQLVTIGPGRDHATICAAIAAELPTAFGSFVFEVDPAGNPYGAFTLDRTGIPAPLELTIRPMPGSAEEIQISTADCGTLDSVVVLAGDGPAQTTVRLEDTIIDGAGFTHAGILATDVFLGLERCVVRNASGGGVLGFGATMEIDGSAFTANSGTLGGALRLEGGSSALVERTVFLDNTAFEGAAIYVGTPDTMREQENTLSLRLSRVDGNEAASGGGGLYAGRESLLDIETTGFLGNSAGDGNGGGVHVVGTGASSIRNCVLDGNLATLGQGGGVFTHDGFQSNLLIENTLMAENEAQDGGGIALAQSFARLLHCTLGDNDASFSGGAGFVDDGSVLEVGDSIVWDNTAAATAPRFLVEPLGVLTEISSNTFQGTADPDPLFTSDRGEPLTGSTDLGELARVYTTPGYYLSASSPAIDAGSAQSCPGGGLCLRTTQATEVLDENAASDLGFHYRAPLKGAHSPFPTGEGDETVSAPVGTVVPFMIRVGTPTSAAVPGQPRYYVAAGSATPGPYVYNGLTLGLQYDAVSDVIFDSVVPSSFGVLDDATDPEGIVDLGLPLPNDGTLVGVSLYLTGWAVEWHNPSGTMIPVDVGPENDPILNTLEIVLTL